MGRSRMSEDIENVEYLYTLVSGETVVAVSGAIKLHAIILNQGCSGEECTLYDAVSGVDIVDNSFARIYCGNGANPPVELKYNIGLNSGLVIICSGAVWNLTALTK